MSTQPEALQLAYELENIDCQDKYPSVWSVPDPCADAAAELRRQHALIAELVEALKGTISEAEHVGSDGWMTGGIHSDEYHAARAAIAKAGLDNPA